MGKNSFVLRTRELGQADGERLVTGHPFRSIPVHWLRCVDAVVIRVVGVVTAFSP
jgi:hypothetical protein